MLKQLISLANNIKSLTEVSFTNATTYCVDIRSLITFKLFGNVFEV